jgi:hypothetical protein
MRTTLQLQNACIPLRLAPGALVCCSAGSLWVTREAARGELASPDIVLAPGQCHRVGGAATYFLTGLHALAPTVCEVDMPRARQGCLRRWLWRWLWR